MTDQMRQLPDPVIYEEEIRKTAWGRMIERVLGIVASQESRFPQARALDLMCGPGFLLNRIKTRCPNYNLTGVDFDSRYIDYARQNYPEIEFVRADVLNWQPQEVYDVITCTGALHHLPYDRQEGFLERVAGMLAPKGIALIGDPYITDYSNERERRLGAVDLGQAFTRSAIEGGASDAVVRASVDVMYNDIFGHEYKTSITKMTPLMERHFSLLEGPSFEGVECGYTWCPDVSKGCGDYLFVLGRKR